MGLVVPKQGEVIFLNAGLNKAAAEDLNLRLYKNNYTPDQNTTEANMTQADFTGYDEIELDAATWATVEGAPSQASYPRQEFVSSANGQNQSVYGYYVAQRISGKLVWAERFSDGPYTIVNSGDVIKVTPKITAN